MSKQKEDAKEWIIAQIGMNAFLLLSTSLFLIYQNKAFSGLEEIVSLNHLDFDPNN